MPTANQLNKTTTTAATATRLKGRMVIAWHFIGFVILICTAGFMSSWLWMRILYALCYFEMASVAVGGLKLLQTYVATKRE